MSAVLDGLEVPIVGAPMAGGPSTPGLAAAVSGAGGIGFLGAGYKTVEGLRQDVTATRAIAGEGVAFGVNVFTPGAGVRAEPEALAAYAERLAAEGFAVGTPRHDDDAFAGKMEALVADPVAVVSFTFGLPPVEAVEALRRAGSEVWITVTSAAEARAAAALGPEALIVQGVEAGGHRGVFADGPDASDLTLLSALQLVRAAMGDGVALVATGGLTTGAAIGAALVAGARAAQVGTAYLLADEAGTSAAQRDATMTDAPTALTRAFSGRTARGIVNRFLREHADGAPPGYPEVHHLTTPLRAHGRATDDPEVINLWAGQAHALARTEPAAEITRRLAADARAAIGAAAERWR